MYNFPEEEKKILKFWEENKIFQKLRGKNTGKKPWSFLDGPITANNPMGVHHAWGRTYKDLLQRYFAMRGFDERYQNGFDCQGLWVEVEVEKELGFKTKKDIEAYGIDKFVEKCKERVKKYSTIQAAQSVRLGQWMDWENSYYTMSDENNYAIWHFLKECWKKGYLYKGRDSVPWCPRCGTAISQHEILTEEYKEVVHDSVYFKLPIVGRPPSHSSFAKATKDKKASEGQGKNEFLLVWTTTPWTLPANIAVAMDEKIDYALVEQADGEKLWMAAALVEKIYSSFPRKAGIDEEGSEEIWGKEAGKINSGILQNTRISKHKILKTVKGRKLVGLKYSFAFDDLPRVREVAAKNPKTFHTVIATDERIMPITTEDGTGLVHTAVSAGQEDFQLGKKLDLPLIEVIDEEANYIDGLGEFSSKNAKKHPEIILDYLRNSGDWVFKTEPYKHKYPTCWRCKTELVWRVVDEWYIAMDAPSQKSKIKNKKSKSLRESLTEIVKDIRWIPEFGLERELDWLKNMHDWLISKKRYWGLALPIFECKECGNFEVIGSKEELRKRAVEGWEKFNGNSPHRPWVDAVKIKCKKCKKPVERIKDVGNPWLDAGIAPFSTINYFSDKKYWKKWFPVEIVCESFPGQFKNWFYSILVMSAALENTAPVKTIFGFASVRDEKGEEMHKSKGNAIWFDEAVEKIGADPMRWMYARQNPAENLNFGYKSAEEIKRKLLTLYNSYIFFATYVGKKEFPSEIKLSSANVLDKWIISKVNHLASVVEFNLNKYDIAKTVLTIEDFFVNDLSLWYIRRTRKRFHLSPTNFGVDKEKINSEKEINPPKLVGDKDRKEAIETLYYVLLNTAKIIAPIMPFFAETMYQELKTSDMLESVHLCDWPKINEKQTNLELEQKMDEARNIVALALTERAAKKIRVRQPLALLKIKNQKSKIKNNEDLLNLVKDEVNVKKIVFDSSIKENAELDLNITKELREEGIVREVIRFVQDMRREAGLKPGEKILIQFSGNDNIVETIEKSKEPILEEVGAIYDTSKKEFAGLLREITVDGQKITAKIKKA